MNWDAETLGCVERLQRVRNGESPESVYGIEDVDCMETDRDIVIDVVLDYGLITPPSEQPSELDALRRDAELWREQKRRVTAALESLKNPLGSHEYTATQIADHFAKKPEAMERLLDHLESSEEAVDWLVFSEQPRPDVEAALAEALEDVVGLLKSSAPPALMAFSGLTLGWNETRDVLLDKARAALALRRKAGE